MDFLRFDIRIAVRDRLLVDIRDFRVPLHCVTFLFGESGIGKSLIARAVYGLLDPAEFDITINGEPYAAYLKRTETAEIRSNSFYVFQEPSSHLNPLLSLQTQLNEGSLAQAPDGQEIFGQLWPGADREEIKKLLDVYPKPYRPSGGEKQRMFLAMALKKMDMMLHKEQRGVGSLFVFDEPTGSLDNCLRDVFLSLLFSRFRQQNLTTLLITHDYSMVSEVARSHHAFADRVSFKELTLQRTGLTLREFEPEAYLGWLEQLKKKSSSQQSANPTRPLIRVASGAEVFGQQLIISKDPEAPEPCPLEIFPGTLAYVKAPSGTGKTTLVKMMMGLVRGDRLQLSLDGVALSERTPRRFWQERIWGKKMTMVFQHADEALNPRSTVAETFRGLPSKNRITVEDIRRTLGELFDIELTDDFLNKQVSMLSGGQKQRLNLLRSLFLNTDILILDEPLNGLDFESSTKVLAMLTHKQRMGKGILLISHNEEIFDRLVLKEHVYYLHTQPAKGE